MSIVKKSFGVIQTGEETVEYTLINQNGASVSICNYGGIITKIVVPDRSGKLMDVCLGFDSVEGYLSQRTKVIGAVIGRVCNRIANAQFELDGTTYLLPQNAQKSTLHGGPNGFNTRIWDACPTEINGNPAVILQLTSPDGDQGFPGRLDVQVTYTFTQANELHIQYRATTDKPTLVNLTNHAYFNLDGHAAGRIDDLHLKIFAPFFCELGEGTIPTGKLLPAKESFFGFQEMTRIGGVLQQILAGSDAIRGIDHNFCAGRPKEVKKIATLYSPKTGCVMDVITDQPGVQFNTGQGLNTTGKEGASYVPYTGLCLETQHYPDAIHHPNFPSVVLRPQEVFESFTAYQFSTRHEIDS